MTTHSTFIGMDIHKNSIDIAIAQSGRKGQVRHYGKIDGTLSALDKVVRKGELTAVYVPLAEDEAIRDLIRAREDAKGDEKKSKQRLMAFLLRSGLRYTGRSPWSQVYMRWLSDIKMPHRSQQIVLQEYIDTLNQRKEQVQRLTEQIRELLPEWQLFPIVEAFQSMRGVSTIVAATTVAEVGDLKRFQTAQELMSYLGLVPSEHSSGQKIRRGPITHSFQP